VRRQETFPGPGRYAIGWIAAAALLSVGLSGCSLPNAFLAKASPSPSAQGSKPGGLDPGWSQHKDAGARFAVAFPDAWVKAQRDSPTLAADLDAIDHRSPELGPYFRDNLKAGSATGPVLLAADPLSLPLGYATNLAVFRSDVGTVAAAPDLEGASRAKVRALTQDRSIVGAVTQQRVRLGGVGAERLAYGFKTGTRSVHVVAYLLLADADQHRYEYELSMGGAITDYAQVFDRIASSFTLVPPASVSRTVSPSPSR
jgi:hypothetical protein